MATTTTTTTNTIDITRGIDATATTTTARIVENRRIEQVEYECTVDKGDER